MKIRKQRHASEHIPPWYYGLAYIDWKRMGMSIWYPIPLNYLIRLRRWISHRWNRFRKRPGHMDRALIDECQRRCELCTLRMNIKTENQIAWERSVQARHEATMNMAMKMHDILKPGTVITYGAPQEHELESEGEK